MYNSHVSDQGLKFGKVQTDFDHFYTNFTDQSDTAEIFKVGWDQGFVHVVSGPLQGSPTVTGPEPCQRLIKVTQVVPMVPRSTKYIRRSVISVLIPKLDPVGGQQP